MRQNINDGIGKHTPKEYRMFNATIGQHIRRKYEEKREKEPATIGQLVLLHKTKMLTINTDTVSLLHNITQCMSNKPDSVLSVNVLRNQAKHYISITIIAMIK